MAKDFRAKQVRTQKIIGRNDDIFGKGSGQDASKIQLALMKSGSANFSGGVVTSQANAHVQDVGRLKAAVDGYAPAASQNTIGKDVWMVVDGNSHKRNERTEGGSVLFLGDVVVSGTLYTERMRTVIHTTDATSNTSHAFITSGSIFIGQNHGISVGKTVLNKTDADLFIDPRDGGDYPAAGASNTDSVFWAGNDPGNDNDKENNSAAHLLTIKPDLGITAGDDKLGRVGVGLGVPKSKLEVRGVVDADSNLDGVADDSNAVAEQFRISHDDNNYASFRVLPDGSTRIRTSEGDTDNDAHLYLDAEGDIELDSATGITKFKLNNDDSDLFTITVAANGETTMQTTDAVGTLANLNIAVDGTTDVQSYGNVTIDSSNGTIGIGTDGNTGAINIGTNSNPRAITVGNKNTTSSLVLQSGTGDIKLDSTDDIDIDAADVITIDTTSSDGHIAITSAHGAGDSIVVSANADPGSKLHILAGIKDVDVQGAYSLDATGISLDSDAASNFSVDTSGGNAVDLTVSVDGGGDSSLIMTSDGTGADAVTLSATAGSMLIGSALVDEKTLTLGNTSSTSMVLSPSSTTDNEKIHIKNAGGTRSSVSNNAAIHIEAAAGGITLDAQKNIQFDTNGGEIFISDGGRRGFLFDHNRDNADPRRLRIYDKASSSVPDNDYLDIEVGEHGVSTIKSVDGDGTRADITLDADGAIYLDSHTGYQEFRKAGVTQYLQFSNGSDISWGGYTGTSGAYVFSLQKWAYNSAGQPSVRMLTDHKLEFRDEGLSVHSSADGQLDINADTELQITTPTVDISNNLVVGGNLTVQGDTTTLNVATLQVEDQTILIGKAADDTGTNRNGGIVLEQGGSAANIDLVIGRVANDTWGFGLKNTTQGSDVDLTAMTLTTIRASKLELQDTDNFIRQTSGGVEVQSDVSIQLDAPIVDFEDDGVVLQFGAGDDVTLTHVHDTGLLLNTNMQLQFGDAATHIKQVSDSNLEIEADGSLIIDTPVVDFDDDGVVLKFGASDEVTLTHVHNQGLLLSDDSGIGTTKLMFGDSATYIHQSADSKLDLVADGEIHLDTPQVLISQSVSHQDTAPTLILQTTDTGTNDGPVLRFEKKAGVPVDGENLGEIYFMGYSADGNTGYNSAAIVAEASSNWTAGSAHPTDIKFGTASATAVNEHVIITSIGRMGIGTMSPGTKLEVFADTTQQKWSYDADSSATMTVAQNSHTTLATAETGNVIIDAGGGILLDAHNGVHHFKREGAEAFILKVEPQSAPDSKTDILFKVKDGASAIDIFRLDTSAQSLLMDTNKKIQFREATTFIHSPGANTLDIETGTGNNGVINIGTDNSSAITIGKAGSGGTTTIHNLTLGSISISGNTGAFTFHSTADGGKVDPVIQRNADGVLLFSDHNNQTPVGLTTLAQNNADDNAFTSITAASHNGGSGPAVLRSGYRTLFSGPNHVRAEATGNLLTLGASSPFADDISATTQFFVSGSVEPSTDTYSNATKRRIQLAGDTEIWGTAKFRGNFTGGAGGAAEGNDGGEGAPASFVMQVKHSEVEVGSGSHLKFANANTDIRMAGNIEFTDSTSSASSAVVLIIDQSSGYVQLPSEKELQFGADTQKIHSSASNTLSFDAPKFIMRSGGNAGGSNSSNLSGLFVQNNGSSGVYYVMKVATTGAGNSFTISNKGMVGIGRDASTMSADDDQNARLHIDMDATPAAAGSKALRITTHSSQTGDIVQSIRKASLTGTVTHTGGSATLTGSGTAFTSQVKIGDRIKVNGTAERTVATISSDTSLTMTTNYVTAASGVSATSERDLLILDSDGKLGIGETNPDESLHIKSDHKAAIILEADTDNGSADPEGSELGTAFVKMTQDTGLIGAILGLTPDIHKAPDNSAYTNAQNNSLLIGTVTSGTQLHLGTFANVRMTISQDGVFSFHDNNLLNIGTLDADTIQSDDDAVGLNVNFDGNTGTNKISLGDNLADALNITEAGNSYLKFITANTTEKIEVYKDFIPNGSVDLGSDSNRFANIYTNDLNLCNEGRGNDVDGTSGNWTIQEGEDNLYVINNITGKKFKMMLQPVEDGE